MSSGGMVVALPGPATLDTLGAFAVYAVVLGFVLVECGLLVGFLLPGDTLLFAAGIVAADGSHGVHVAWLSAGVFAAAVAGECLGYLIGARGGTALLRRHAGRTGERGSLRLARAERFTARYGVVALVAARWVPWVRTFAPVLAGATGMAWPRFMAANALGALCWAPTLVLLGYAAADVPALRHASVAVAGVVIGLAVLASVLRYWRSRRSARPARSAGPGGVGRVGTGAASDTR